ncbi:uncharacterized protein F5147DRAFT_560963, partial [Suillus discolor]
EYIHHLLLTCSDYILQHNNLRMSLGTKAYNVKHILNVASYLKSLFKYIANTRRFTSVFGDV